MEIQETEGQAVVVFTLEEIEELRHEAYLYGLERSRSLKQIYQTQSARKTREDVMRECRDCP